METTFSEIIQKILKDHFSEVSSDIYEKSYLLQYLNNKTKSANKGSKSRASFANLYAIYVLVEDYLKKGFDKNNTYSDYEGAIYIDLFNRQRSLPFGDKLQNHALNNRLNSEFEKFFPSSEVTPILRQEKRYWINENLLIIKVGDSSYNISNVILSIVDKYIETRQDSLQSFIETCNRLQKVENENPDHIQQFILSLLAPNSDARLFEIVSYSILKYFYIDQKIFWGYTREALNEEYLKLYKTGRTNANDGGIDFVMKPLGKFFQVTETLDFKKYFLDIDKVQKFPITFIIKSEEPIDSIKLKIKSNAIKAYRVKSVVESYMNCIEEIINIELLVDKFNQSISKGYLQSILNELIIQSKVEFNFQDEDELPEIEQLEDFLEF